MEIMGISGYENIYKPIIHYWLACHQCKIRMQVPLEVNAITDDDINKICFPKKIQQYKEFRKRSFIELIRLSEE